MRYINFFLFLTFSLFSSHAVLIHGCHLMTEEWENIVFGIEQQKGRVVKALEEALEKNVKQIIWGSGASKTREGVQESEYAYSLSIGAYLPLLSNHLILVSSPTHIARCLQEACKIETGLKIYATFSDVCYAGSKPDDVVIFEPPHRIDRSSAPLHLLGKKILEKIRQDDALFTQLFELVSE